MHFEITPVGFNPAEYYLRASRGVDLTEFSLGTRMRELGIGEDDLESDARVNTFRTAGAFNPRLPTTLLLPGIAIEADVTFQHQIEVLKIHGNVVYVDYANQVFDQEVLRAQILDFMESDAARREGANLMGLSFGSSAILDLLVESPEADLSKLRRVILLGAIFSPDDLGETLGKFIRSAGSNAHRVKTHVKKVLDKEYFTSGIFNEEDVIAGINEDSDGALVARNQVVSKREFNIEDIEGPPRDIPALLIWWSGRAEVQPDRQHIIADYFTETVIARIPGLHGQVATQAKFINPLVDGFLSLT